MLNLENITVQVKVKRLCFFSAFIIQLLCISINAQTVYVSAKLDTNQIKIGMQTTLLLKAIAAEGIKVKFPVLADTIIGNVEIVSQSKIDTNIAPGGKQYELQKKIVITSFDSGFYAIPPFKFIINNDSTQVAETEALLFGVQTISVDTTLAIKNIKGPLSPGWSIREILNEIVIGLVILLAIALAVYYFMRRNKKAVVEEQVIVKIPAHEKALTALQRLQDEKLWQQGQVKQYHIQLSDIVRTYMEERFDINALEMTSDEILRALRHIGLDDDWKTKLSRMLILNDMVKFAKESPLPNENEWCIDMSFDFVKSTAKHIIQEEKEVSGA